MRLNVERAGMWPLVALAVACLAAGSGNAATDVGTVEELLSAFKAGVQDIKVTNSLYRNIPTNGYDSYARYNDVRQCILVLAQLPGAIALAQ